MPDGNLLKILDYKFLICRWLAKDVVYIVVIESVEWVPQEEDVRRAAIEGVRPFVQIRDTRVLFPTVDPTWFG